ncbi:MAG: hypothetical protein ACE5DN_06950 [Flavobacteriales bacterium]
MKRSIAFIFVLLVFAACEKTKDLLTFEFDQSSEFTVPAFPLVIDTTFTISLNDVPTNSDKVFSDNGTSPDLVKDIKLAAMSLQVLSPSSQDLSFLKSIAFYISATGLSEKLLASKNSVPDNVGQQLDMDVTAEPLDEYIKQDKINLRIEVAADKSLAQDTRLQADMTYSVTADPL